MLGKDISLNNSRKYKCYSREYETKFVYNTVVPKKKRKILIPFTPKHIMKELNLKMKGYYESNRLEEAKEEVYKTNHKTKLELIGGTNGTEGTCISCTD